jgi:hypothetical protein
LAIAKSDGPLPESVSVVSVAGRSWQRWICNASNNCEQDGVPVISYIPNHQGTVISEMSFDLRDFIRNAVDANLIQSGWYLSNVFAGFEIWNGGQGLKLNEFKAVVQ